MAEKTSKSLTHSEPQVAADPFESWTPFRELFAPGGRLPRFFDEMFPTRGARAGRWSPAVDIAEDDQKFVITAELPGTAKDDVHVEVHENVMTIRGEKRSEREEKKEKARWLERSYGAFTRAFTLPADAAPDKVSASFENGILKIEIAKRAEAKPKTIAIKG